MATKIKWEDPPLTAGAGGRGAWAKTLAPLRERPGQWANLGVHNKICASSINHGRYHGIEAGEYEATTRHQKDGQATLYVRYIGGDSA